MPHLVEKTFHVDSASKQLFSVHINRDFELACHTG